MGEPKEAGVEEYLSDTAVPAVPPFLELRVPDWARYAGVQDESPQQDPEAEAGQGRLHLENQEGVAGRLLRALVLSEISLYKYY